MARFKPKPLNDILAGRGGNVESRRRNLVAEAWKPKPLWAIVREAGPWEAARVWSQAGPPKPLFQARANNEPSRPVGPEECAKHYPKGSVERAICEGAGDTPYFNCVRACIIDHLPPDWDANDIDRLDPDWIQWMLIEHPECFAKCAEKQ